MALLLVGMIGCSEPVSDEYPIYSVSFVSILVDPEPILKYGHAISVIGYLTASGRLSLYLSKDHALALDVASSVLVVDNTEDGEMYGLPCLENYVEVVGTLVRNEGRGLELTDIQELIWTLTSDQAGLRCYESSLD